MGDSSAAPRGPVTAMIPEGDERTRLVCTDCGYVAYENPKIVVGSVVRYQDRYLLCRRAIDPRKGYWTLPAGYLELGESTEGGALREAWEEARARIRIDGLLAIFSIQHLSQVQLIYRASLLDAAIAAGPESLEVNLFRWEEIPWADIAFPSVRWSLDADRKAGDGPLVPVSNPQTEPAPKLPGGL